MLVYFCLLPIPFCVPVQFWPLAVQDFGITENTKQNWDFAY